MKTNLLILLIFSSLLLFSHCNRNLQDENTTNKTEVKGKLFIIGGGYKPESLIKDMVQLAGLDSGGYIVVLPMSSNEPDTAVYYSIKQFNDAGVDKVYAFNIQSDSDITKNILDSVLNAGLIYISGGDQNLFMEKIIHNDLYNVIHKAYENGSMIAGTSAGAALMSEKMITGNQHKHQEYSGFFRTIEANNIEIGQGLGFLQNTIIDQHFVKRMRLNRLISACLENPENECIGIDESTAILVEGKKISVYGNSQVIVLNHNDAETKIVNGLLGAKNLSMDIYLPGDTFYLKK